MRKNFVINNILRKPEFATKIRLFFSSAAPGDFYDSYENNLTFSNLNPITIKGYVRNLSPETAFWKQYGLHEAGMMEILCEAKYSDYFKRCNKISIGDSNYQVYKDGGGTRTMITERPMNLLRVVVSKLD